MELRIRVDRGVCMGSGQCVHWAPGVFDQDDEGISIVVDPSGEPEHKIVQAVTACPVQAISLIIDGTRVGPDDLRDWVHGTHSDDPLVEVLATLSDEHHHLRTALGTPPSDVTAVEMMSSLTSNHLRNEDQAYSAIAELVGSPLVDAFDEDHARIKGAVDDLVANRADPGGLRRAAADLANAVDDHIRLEETVLFPVALAVLARRRFSHPAGAS